MLSFQHKNSPKISGAYCEFSNRSLITNSGGTRFESVFLVLEKGLSAGRENRSKLIPSTDMPIHLPEAPKTRGLLSQVETLHKHIALTCQCGTRCDQKALGNTQE